MKNVMLNSYFADEEVEKCGVTFLGSQHSVALGEVYSGERNHPSSSLRVLTKYTEIQGF